MSKKQIFVILAVVVLAVVAVAYMEPLSIVTSNHGPGVSGTTDVYCIESTAGCTQSFTLPAGKNRLVNFIVATKQSSTLAGAKVVAGVASTLTWNENDWMVKQTHTLYPNVPGAVILGDETTEYNGGQKYYVMLKLAPTETGKWLNLGHFSTDKYPYGDLYNNYDMKVCTMLECLDLGFTAQVGWVENYNTPPVCNGITGETTPELGNTYTYHIDGYDADGDSLSYYVDWGDGTNSGWKTNKNLQHQWLNSGTCYVRAKVKDSKGAESGFCTPLAVTVSDTPVNNPPVCTGIVGPDSVSVGVSNSFGVRGSDPDGDTLSYYIDWGDGTNSGWGSSMTKLKTWDIEGIYQIKAKVRDSYGLESGYCTSVPVQVTGGSGDFYTMTFIVYDKETGLVIPGVPVIFDSKTQSSDLSGTVVFDSIEEGVKTVTVDVSSYKSLSASIDIVSSETKYIILAPLSSNYNSAISDSPPGGPESPFDLSMIVILIVVGLILSVIIGLIVKGVFKYVSILILWIILLLIYFLNYMGFLVF